MPEEALTTPSLVLRPWLPGDEAFLAHLAADASVRAATGLCPSPTPQQLTRALDELAGEPEVYAIVSRKNPQEGPIGSIALRIGGLSGLDLDEDEGAIDFWAAEALREAGSLPEAVDALMRHGFEELGLTTILYVTDGGDQHRITRADWQTARKADPVEQGYVDGKQREADSLDSSIPRIAYVRSGGQTGADRGALDAARDAGTPICGWCPARGLAEDEPVAPGVRARYPELRETASPGYVDRTAWNVRDSHATLVVAPAGLEPRSGTEMTVRFALSYGRPVLVVTGEDDLPQVRTWLAGLGRGITLNVAGPRESKLPGTYEATRRLVRHLLEENGGSAVAGGSARADEGRAKP